MKPAAFEIVRASSIPEATRLLHEANGTGRVIAGAQSLGPMLNLRLAQPRVLIDLTGIRELTSITEEPDWITVGACITTANIEDGRLPGRGLDHVRAVAGRIAYRAVRNRGTIGGSLCHADPAADWVSVLCALGAECRIAGRGGTRKLAADQFVTGAYETALENGEVLEAIRIPRLCPHARFGYFKICRKAGEFALAMGAVLRDPEREQFRIVIGATSGRPIVIADARELMRTETDLDEAALLNVFDRHGITEPTVRRQQLSALARANERTVKS